MPTTGLRSSFACFIFAWVFTVLSSSQVRADPASPTEFRAQFFKLCDLAAVKVSNENSKGPFFVDSYAVRALCAAYDLTGSHKYLDACRAWSERMVKYQQQMIPAGAYYMHYNRKPGSTNGDWYTADSSSIAMAVLATSVRCDEAERKRLLASTIDFANLVLKNYVKPSGGVSDGLWSKSDQEWWCSSGLFGSFLFNLYANTGERRYLQAGLGAVDWLNDWDLTKDQPFPLSQQGPAMLMYVMECYSAGWPYLTGDDARKKAALAKVSWCFDWITAQQQKPIGERPWAPTTGWGLKFGGLPFHEYIFSHFLPDGKKLSEAGDRETQQLDALVFDQKSKLTQLQMFMLFSYAERLTPGAVYRSANRKPANGFLYSVPPGRFSALPESMCCFNSANLWMLH